MELLVSMTIVLILAGLVLPVVGQSRGRALEADTLSKLKQLSIAARLYRESYGDEALGIKPLVDSGLVTEKLCYSEQDRYPRGLSNERLSVSGTLGQKRFMTSYKKSFIALQEYIAKAKMFHDRFVEGDSSGGWLIDALPMNQNELPEPGFWTGRYRRLMNDGSVQMRTKTEITCGGGPDGKPSPCTVPILFFVDPKEEILEWARSLK